jgi:translation initiation factor IF-2
MADNLKATRLNKAAAEFNVGIFTIIEFLAKKGITIDENPNAKISPEIYQILLKEFRLDKETKEKSREIGLAFIKHETISIEDKPGTPKKEQPEPELEEVFIKGSSVSFDEDIVSLKELQKTKKQGGEEMQTAEVTPKKKAETKPAVTEVPKKATAKVPETSHPKKAGRAEAKAVAGTTEPAKDEKQGPKVLGTIDLAAINQKTKPAKKTKDQKAKGKKKTTKDIPVEEVASAGKVEEPVEVIEAPVDQAEPEAAEKEADKKETPPVPEKAVRDANFIPTRFQKLQGPKILDKIELPEETPAGKKPVASSKDEKIQLKKKKRKRIRHEKFENKEMIKDTREKPKGGKFRKRDKIKPELSEEEIQKQIKETLARLAPMGKSKAAKYRRQKRDAASQTIEKERQKLEEEKSILKVTEFVTVNEMANMMNVPVNEVISTFMQLGMFVSINQRLDAESLALVAEEFGYKVEFVSVDVQEAIELTQEADAEEDLAERPPIATVMGHVDHGKTKLLDYIRSANVVAGEAGGITQHIGAYEVTLENNKKITFLDTPGHEAFTAMRARGAQVTDVAIIVIAADDDVMPQTKEAINHAQAAGVPMIFAINKVDKPNANPDKIKEQLSKMNFLVEEWGGKYQSQEISAKQGTNVDLLLEKVLLEAEMLELKANRDRPAYGTVIESSLDKGRGYVAKLLVQNGTLKIGDIVLAGAHFGKVKAMYNERNQRMDDAGPSQPILLLGLDGAPQAGDKFNVMKDEREAKAIATKRLQLQREQGIRSQKHITLDEIGRRIAIGDFKELNLIVKADVDGSVEALSDSLLKLSTPEVQVNVIHKSVGQVTESDVLLASASDAIIIGFQVRPSVGARKLAEQEQIDIRFYSIIYQAIEAIKSAIEGMLAPEIEEKITSNLEVREVFRITKVGTVAGCMVLDGKLTRNTKVRVIRDGIVVYSGKLGSLKRFKEDVKEVVAGYECGLNIDNFNDIKAGDIIEGYEEVEVRRKL